MLSVVRTIYRYRYIFFSLPCCRIPRFQNLYNFSERIGGFLKTAAAFPRWGGGMVGGIGYRYHTKNEMIFIKNTPYYLWSIYHDVIVSGSYIQVYPLVRLLGCTYRYIAYYYRVSFYPLPAADLYHFIPYCYCINGLFFAPASLSEKDLFYPCGVSDPGQL